MLEGEIIPTHILQDIFPVNEFAGKTSISQRGGRIHSKEIEQLLKWGEDMYGIFYFVEISKQGNSTLYASAAK